jgi:hypothetical protein
VVTIDQGGRTVSTTGTTVARSSRKPATRSRTAYRTPSPLPADVLGTALDDQDASGEGKPVSDATTSNKDRLADLTARIRSGLQRIVETEQSLEAVRAEKRKHMVETGLLLKEVRDEKLWQAEYKSWNDYCRSSFGFGASRARQKILAARAVTESNATGVNESQIRRQARAARGNPESGPVAVCCWCHKPASRKRLQETLAAILTLHVEGAEVGGYSRFGISEVSAVALRQRVVTVGDLQRVINDPIRSMPGIGPKMRERINRAIEEETERLLCEYEGIARLQVVA